MNAPERSELSHLTLDDLAKLGVPGLISTSLLMKILTPEGTEDGDSCLQYSIKELFDFLIIQIKTGSLSSDEFSSLCESLSILKSENNAKLLLYEAEVDTIMSLNAVSAEPAPTEVIEKPDSKKKPWYKRRGLVLGAALTALTAADYGRNLLANGYENITISRLINEEICKLLDYNKIPIVERKMCEKKAKWEAILTETHPLDAVFVLPYYVVHQADRSKYLTLGSVLDDIRGRRLFSLYFAQDKAELACVKAVIEARANAIKPEK